MFYLLFLLPLAYGYQAPKTSLSSSEILRYKNYFRPIPFKTLVEEMDSKQIESVYFTPGMDSVIAEEKEKSETSIADDYTTTQISPSVSNYIVDDAMKQGVKPVFLQNPQPTVIESFVGGTFQVFNFIFPFIILSSIISVFRASNMNSPNNFMNGGGINNKPGMFNFGKNDEFEKDNMLKSNITLDSFAGSPEIFQECTEIVSYLKNATLYEIAGAEIPRGVLLEGPPGTGKTLLAKAIASEADANFISIAASEFVEVYVGLGASKIRSLFKKARENTPCIIFIDEIDAVGRQRGAGVNMANDEREQTLNQLLAEMDGFADNEGILIMGATNRKDVLDQALLRPGRFDRLLMVPLPDVTSRLSILKVHSKNKELEEDVDLNFLADLTSGFSGAQLKNLMNEGAIHAAREGKSKISRDNLLEALDKLIIGIVKKTDTRDDEARRRVAIHETGHALLAALFDKYFELKKVSIQSTYSGAGGYTVFNEHRNISESGLYTKDLLTKRLVIALGGKAAETIMYGEEQVSLGAVQDLKQANDLAKKMIGNFGMGTKLEVFYNDGVDNGNPFLGRALSNSGGLSEHTKYEFDKEVLELVNEAYKMAKTFLRNHRSIFDNIVNDLLENDILIGNEVKDYLNNCDQDDDCGCDV
jgi:cell division protease FtsH